jgi:geranylgeranyl diphosphate synthase, type II
LSNSPEGLGVIENAADLFVGIVQTLSSRAPAIVASAAHALGPVKLCLHFGDGSQAWLHREHSRLLVGKAHVRDPCVEVYFDDRSLKLLFDAQHRPVDSVLERSLDVRGTREDLLATWRCFSLLAQRAAGLRAVQALWCEYRDLSPSMQWGEPAAVKTRRQRNNHAFRVDARWPAITYLNNRYPADIELRAPNSEAILSPARSIWDGATANSWREHPNILDNDLNETMQRLKTLVVEEIMHLVPRRQPRAELYDLMTDYVTREGKGLRPTLVIATCMALGGRTEDAVRAAAALEMYHNGFLVHDDIADESTHRRGKPTLHLSHGIGLALNAGDAMNLFAVDLVLSNLPTLGLARTLGLIHEILHMCRETVEGQAIELGWIRRNFVPVRDADYSRMSTKKTGWYTCISPCRMGAVASGETDPERLDRFNEAFRLIGIAFQIQDDVLNLVAETALYGKEALGDLLEGKRTVMMIHLFRTAKAGLRRRMQAINSMSRAQKTLDNALEMLEAMKRQGSIDYAIALADRFAREGVKLFERDLAFIEENPAKAILRQVANYVTTRAL